MFIKVRCDRVLRPFGFDFSYGMMDDGMAMNESPNREVAVFAAAVELPAAQRAAYLDQACAGDPTLRAQVEALLRVHDDADGFFDALAPVARPAISDGALGGSSDT